MSLNPIQKRLQINPDLTPNLVQIDVYNTITRKDLEVATCLLDSRLFGKDGIIRLLKTAIFSSNKLDSFIPTHKRNSAILAALALLQYDIGYEEVQKNILKMYKNLDQPEVQCQYLLDVFSKECQNSLLKDVMDLYKRQIKDDQSCLKNYRVLEMRCARIDRIPKHRPSERTFNFCLHLGG